MPFNFWVGILQHELEFPFKTQQVIWEIPLAGHIIINIYLDRYEKGHFYIGNHFLRARLGCASTNIGGAIKGG